MQAFQGPSALLVVLGPQRYGVVDLLIRCTVRRHPPEKLFSSTKQIEHRMEIEWINMDFFLDPTQIHRHPEYALLLIMQGREILYNSRSAETLLQNNYVTTGLYTEIVHPPTGPPPNL